IWNALTTRHAHFALGAPPALRYRSDIEPLVAAADDSQDAADATLPLIEPGETVLMIQANAPTVPRGALVDSDRLGVQMIAATLDFSPLPPPGAEPLGDSDAAEMIALAE